MTSGFLSFCASQQALPFGFLESGKDDIAADYDGALYEHAVCRKQTELLILGHGGKLVLQTHGFVQQTAGVEKALERQTAHFVPRFELVIAGIILLDMAFGIGKSVVIEPDFGLFAG